MPLKLGNGSLVGDLNPLGINKVAFTITPYAVNYASIAIATESPFSVGVAYWMQDAIGNGWPVAQWNTNLTGTGGGVGGILIDPSQSALPFCPFLTDATGKVTLLSNSPNASKPSHFIGVFAPGCGFVVSRQIVAADFG